MFTAFLYISFLLVYNNQNKNYFLKVSYLSSGQQNMYLKNSQYPHSEDYNL